MNSDLPSWTPPQPPSTIGPHCCICGKLIKDFTEARVLVTVDGSRIPSEMRHICGQQCLVHARGKKSYR